MGTSRTGCLPGNNKEAVAPRRYNLLHELGSVCPDRVQLRDELLNVLLAARDLTAALLSSKFYFLSCHSQVWQRLQNEVASLDGLCPTYEQVKNLKYVRAIVDEGMLK